MTLTAINMAIPQCSRPGADDPHASMLDRMAVLFELFLGSSSVVMMIWSPILQSPASEPMLAAAAGVLDGAPDPLDSVTKAAIARLKSMVEDKFSLMDASIGATSQGQLRESYGIAVRLLHQCFIEDAKNSIIGFCISFPMFAGPNVAASFRALEPVTLFIMMYWGVLLDRLGKLAWWAKPVGRNLVLEISELLWSQLQFNPMPEWREGLAWSRGEVGLSQL
jgi:hypothetical protein